MKKIVVGILLLVLLLTGCSPTNQKLGESMLERYSNDQNYVALSGEILEYNQGHIRIKSEDLKTHAKYTGGVWNFIIYSPQSLDLTVGDTIEFITDPFPYYSGHALPIVSVKVGDTTLLDFEDGKEELLEFVRKMRDSKHPYRLSKEETN